MADNSGQITVAQNGVTALNGILQAIKSVFATITGTSTSATAGSNGDVPAQVVGYITIVLPDGSSGKVPYYNT